MSDFKTQLQKLIDEAADKFDAKNNIETDYYCPYSFKQGAKFLMPLIESLIEIRNNYIDYRCGYPDLDLKTESDKDLLNLLKDGK